MKIYVVTQGDYSDYHIVAVCTKKASAERIKNLLTDGWCDPEIEEYESDVYDINPTYKAYHVVIWKNGDIKCEEEYNSYCAEDVNEYKDWFVYDVFAKDEEHAKKIALDKIAEYKAKKKGLI